jgi:hypothetical protein
MSSAINEIDMEFEEISIFSNSSHLEWRVGQSDTILKGTHPRRQIQHCPISTTFHMWVDYDVPK